MTTRLRKSHRSRKAEAVQVQHRPTSLIPHHRMMRTRSDPGALRTPYHKPTIFKMTTMTTTTPMM